MVIITRIVLTLNFVGFIICQTCYSDNMYHWGLITIGGSFTGGNPNARNVVDGNWLTYDSFGLNYTDINPSDFGTVCTGDEVALTALGQDRFQKIEHTNVAGAIDIWGFEAQAGYKITNKAIGCTWSISQKHETVTDSIIDEYFDNAKKISRFFANQLATHLIDYDGSFVRLDNVTPFNKDYSVVNVYPCDTNAEEETACRVLDASYTSPFAIFHGIPVPPENLAGIPDNILVINVPLYTDLNVWDNDVIAHLDPCKTIWNFYTIGDNNTYIEDGLVDVAFRLSGIFPGTIIISSDFGSAKFENTATIHGQLLTRQFYVAENAESIPSRIIGYKHLSSQCKNVNSCWPMQLSQLDNQPVNTTKSKWVPNVSHLPYKPKTFVATKTPTLTVTETSYQHEATVLPQTKRSTTTTKAAIVTSIVSEVTLHTTQTLFNVISSTDTYSTATSTNKITETVEKVETKVTIISTVTETKTNTTTHYLTSTGSVITGLPTLINEH